MKLLLSQATSSTKPHHHPHPAAIYTHMATV